MRKDVELEKIYQKKSKIEHILIRPDTYVGSIEKTEATMWVKQADKDKFVCKKIEYIPGLYKIFDEIIVNAADNYQRDKSSNTIKVSIDADKNEISVYNNGQGIPVEIHKIEKMYIPEMIFGKLLTGSNFDDDAKKVTGGRNGYGAKLTNIFSKKFIIETADSSRKKKFKMIWENNMMKKSEPIITDYTKEDYTKVTFYPDLKRFKIDRMDDDIIALFVKRVYDLAGVVSNKVKVYLNDTRIQTNSFDKYVELYFNDAEEHVKIQHKTDRWEVICSISDGQFQQVSFVNSIATIRGGKHVNHVADQIVEALVAEVQKKNKKLQLKPYMIKNHLWLFVNCLIENPAFDSQTKETLTTNPTNFGSKCELTPQFIKKLLATDIVSQIVSQAEAKENAMLKKALTGKKRNKIVGINKLEDANWAGSKNSDKCLLILTEGDSAKSLAMAGLEIVGRDRFGVFPLKGKLLNVRDVSSSVITKNEEIQHLIDILGLQFGKEYTDVKSLRYGGIMIMTDQDVDGTHIKGLIINFISHFWPSLIKNGTFLVEFVTPIIKCFKKKEVVSFFTLQDFQAWSQNQDMKKWKIKYYKGLGTSSNAEAREYFSDIVKHKIDFEYIDQEDFEQIDLLFNKKKADERKHWLTTFNPNTFVNHNVKKLRYKDFVDKELIHFSMYDNIRSIPSMVDGFKPGQRKILFSCFKRKLKTEIKVAQLSGYVAEQSAYHHGEMSLQMTIVNLAQNYVGSNNINLLMPEGQFGTRTLGGKDAASARYIYTYLNKITRFIFSEHDDHVLTYINDEGQIVEPIYYVPIIPMVLVNGAEGIGTGWSTFVPCFSPKDIVNNIRRKLNGEELLRMKPYYRGFLGDIIEEPKGYTVKGIYNVKLDEDILEITELPIGKWTRPYKTFLESMMTSDNGVIEDLREYHTSNNVHFQIKLKEGKLAVLYERNDIEKVFKLSGSLSANNYVLFDKDGLLKRYDSEVSILEDFYWIRLQYYKMRKDYLLSALERDIQILDNKQRFILYVVEEKIRIRKVKKKDIVAQLEKLGFTKMKDMPAVKNTKVDINAPVVEPKSDQEEGDKSAIIEEEEEISTKEYSYLLSMALLSLSYEQVERLKREVQGKKEEIETLKRYQEKDMWNDDLDKLMDMLDQIEKEEAVNRSKEDKKLKKNFDKMEKMKPHKRKRKKSPDESIEMNVASGNEAKPRKKVNIKKSKPKTSIVPEEVDNVDISQLEGKNENNLSLKEKLMMLQKKTQGKPSSKQSKPKLLVENIKSAGKSSSKRHKVVLSDDDEDYNPS